MSGLNIKKFLVEKKENPIGLGETRPRFSWIFDSVGYEGQRAYHIRVSAVKPREGDMWDSGEIAGSECLNIAYAGKTLESTCIYYAHLEVIGNSGAKACATATFEMGLLHESDWKGTWAGTNANYQGNTTVVRKVFPLQRTDILRARVYLLGIGYHELFMNGHKVTGDVLAPSTCDYRRRMYYKTYDVTQFLTQGDNCIAVELGYGWYGKKALLLQMFVEYSDHTRYDDQTYLDGQWWVGCGSYMTNSIYGGEIYDASAALDKGDWKLASFKSDWDRDWMYAFYQLTENVPKLADTVEPIRVCREYAPVNVKKVDEQTSVYDFGQNLSGWAKLRLKGTRGSKIYMRYAEQCDKRGFVNQKNLRTAKTQDVYILSGEPQETYAPRFTYHGFQYMQVVTEGDVEILEATAQHVHNDVRQVGAFRCSDETLNRLHECAVITEQNNLHSIMTDCPQRDERLGWLNDLSSRIYQSIHNFDLAQMIPKVLDDIVDTQDEDGAIADTAPFIGGTKPADPICASFILFGWMAYRYYGDKRILEKHFEHFEKWLNYLIGESDGMLLDISYYGDWVVPECYSDTKTSGRYISSAYLNWQIRLMIKIASVLGKEEKVSKLNALLAQSNAALNREYYNEKTKNYGNGLQTENALALSIGYAPEKDRADIAENIAKDVVAKGYHNTSGNQGYRHFFYSMCDAGYAEMMLKVLKNPEYPGWGYMLANGATTIWERWEKTMQLEMHSFDHPMFASFDGIFYNYLAGIQIDENAFGCDSITVRPALETSLQFVDCGFETVRGKISVNWKKVGDRAKITIEIPPTVKARFDFDGCLQDGAKVDRQRYYEAGRYEITAEV